MSKLRSGRAGFETGLERGFIEIAPDKHHARRTGLARLPIALKVAFQNHVNRLEDQTAIFPGDI